MNTSQINQILLVAAWFPLSGLLFIMLLIARFYENLTGEPTRYGFFAVPIILFGVAAAHYASLAQVMGDPLGDFLLFLAGVVLIKTIADPRGVMLALPYVLVGVGCGLFGGGMGN